MTARGGSPKLGGGSSPCLPLERHCIYTMQSRPSPLVLDSFITSAKQIAFSPVFVYYSIITQKVVDEVSRVGIVRPCVRERAVVKTCLLYTSDAADE